MSNYIKNNYSSKYLKTTSNEISGYCPVEQNTASITSTATTAAALSSIWKIEYHILNNSGYYTIGPMHKLDMCLHGTMLNAGVLDDTIHGTGMSYHWQLSGTSAGYVFYMPLYNTQTNEYTDYALSLSSNSSVNGTTVNMSDYASLVRQKWTLLSASENVPNSGGVLLYDTIDYIAPKGSHGFIAAVYSKITNDQTVSWLSAANSKATVGASTGIVSGVAPGMTTIIARALINGNQIVASHQVVVTEIAEGTYFLKNKKR